MFRSGTQTTGNAGAITPVVAAIGTALGIGAAILLTPPVFEWTRDPLFNHLRGSWGSGLAKLLTYAMACVEAFLIYGMTRLAFTLLVILSTAAFAARRFPGT